MTLERRTRRVVPGAVLLGSAAGFGVLALLAATSHGSLLTIDRPVTDALVGARAGWLTSAMKAVTLLGSRPVTAGILLGLVLWGIVLRRCPRGIVVVLAVFAASIALEAGLKPLVGRARPEPVLQLVDTATAAFPSGHATTVAAVFGFLPVVFASGRLPTVVGWAIVAAVGVSRVYLGAHWATDVIGGVLLGSAIAAAGALALRGHRLDPARCPAGHAGFT